MVGSDCFVDFDTENMTVKAFDLDKKELIVTKVLDVDITVESMIRIYTTLYTIVVSRKTEILTVNGPVLVTSIRPEQHLKLFTTVGYLPMTKCVERAGQALCCSINTEDDSRFVPVNDIYIRKAL